MSVVLIRIPCLRIPCLGIPCLEHIWNQQTHLSRLLYKQMSFVLIRIPCLGIPCLQHIWNQQTHRSGLLYKQMSVVLIRMENEDQPCFLSSKSCLVSSNNNTTTIHQPKQKAEKIVVVRTFASHPSNNYSPILLDPSSHFQLPSVWEKMNSEALRRPDVNKPTIPKLAEKFWEEEDQRIITIIRSMRVIIKKSKNMDL